MFSISLCTVYFQTHVRVQAFLVLLQDDPLTETLDQLLPANLRDSVVQVPVNIPQGVKDICAELQKEEGIQSVFLGRQVEERRVVSQVSTLSVQCQSHLWYEVPASVSYSQLDCGSA